MTRLRTDRDRAQNRRHMAEKRQRQREQRAREAAELAQQAERLERVSLQRVRRWVSHNDDVTPWPEVRREDVVRLNLRTWKRE